MWHQCSACTRASGEDLSRTRRRAPAPKDGGPHAGSRPVSRILYRPSLSLRPAAAIHLGRTSPFASCGLPGGCPEGRAGHPCLLLGLAPDGVCRAAAVARDAGELLPHRFTLTRPRPGGLFSVALSADRSAWDIPQRPALWSPDFPRPGVELRAAATRPAPVLIMRSRWVPVGARAPQVPPARRPPRAPRRGASGERRDRVRPAAARPARRP